jgi:hypothetical protein
MPADPTDPTDPADPGFPEFEAGQARGGPFSAEERRALEEALAAQERLLCPACGAQLTQQRVAPTTSVAYVRRRVLVICPSCRRSAGVDDRRKRSRPQPGEE